MKFGWNTERLAPWLKGYRPALLVLAVGLVLLLWPQGQGTGADAAGEGAEAASSDASFDLDGLEERLEQALSQIDGVGEATVVLTLKSSARQVLATDQSGEEEETVIVSTGSSQEQAVTVQQYSPEFQGALVVCPGGGDAGVKLQVLQAVQALTGLNANQISICEGTGGNLR